MSGQGAWDQGFRVFISKASENGLGFRVRAQRKSGPWGVSYWTLG